MGQHAVDFVKHRGIRGLLSVAANLMQIENPSPLCFHDCLHVLEEYETSSIDETQVAAFQAGTLKRDAVYGLLFPLAQFHLGISVTPVTKAERGVIDPDLWIKAFVRGTRTNVDLAASWQSWDDFHRPATELRLAYNIEPRT